MVSARMKVFLQVRVDGASSFHGPGADGDSPGAAFVFAGGKKGNQSEQCVGGANQAHQSAFSQAVAGQELGRIRVTHLRKLRLDLSADRGSPRVGARGDFGQIVLADRVLEIVAQLCAFARR